MHDIQFVRDFPAIFDQKLALRGADPLSAEILAIDKKRRELIFAAETAKAEQNKASKDVGAAKASGDEAEFERVRALVSEKKAEVARLEGDAKLADDALRALLMTIPNMPFDDVPMGESEADNAEIRKWGEPRAMDFQPKEHFAIDAVANLFNFERAGKISGARFAILQGAAARLHRALGQFMIDFHINNHGLNEVMTPVLVRESALLGTGQLPKFKEDLYKTDGDHYLIPTAEVTLTNMAADQIADAQDLPLRMVAQTQCFRSEAGSAGRDTTGILRQHQFEKVEMVTICKPDESDHELERMTACAEAILKALELPFRTVLLCTGDMGFGARRTYDIEVWVPGQNTYREISSCSNCGDFQARRMNARYRNDEGKPEFVHTLNGSGLAVGRCLIAVLENGQQADGSIVLPQVLTPYLGGARMISPTGALS